MTPTRMLARLRVRLHSDERGFSLIETLIAITVIFGSLTALAYTATAGFGYVGFARDRQGATSVANQIMEETRGLAYVKITQGLLTSDLDPVTDSNVKLCSGTYRFKSCSTGEKIVNQAGLSNVTPLVPHTGTISSGYPTTYTWKTYVTNDDPSNNPYRVTVIVSWSSGHVNGVTKSITTQSLFYSPSGCVSSSTHPFAAPCQPFFYSQARAAAPTVTFSGSISGLTFSGATLDGTTAEADGQQEQVNQTQATVSQSDTSLTDGGGTQSGGGTTSTAAAADVDPGSTTGTYQNTSLSAGGGSSFSSTNGSGTTFAVSNAGGDTGSITSAISANSATAACPPSASETDNQPCSYAKVQQAGTLQATLAVNSGGANLGTANLASVGGAGSATTAFTNRTLVSGRDGRLDQTVVRSLGTVNIGGLPANVSSPSGWTGYLMTLSSYADTATASGGANNASAPAGSVTGGSLAYWNGSGYTPLNAASLATAGSIPFTAASVTRTISGHTVVVGISGTATKGGVATTSTGGSGTYTAAKATVGPPVTATLAYTITIDGTTVTNLSITIDLGTITARGQYQAAPSSG
jgi:type II secretory pathway pseudopilin PulG